MRAEDNMNRSQTAINRLDVRSLSLPLFSFFFSRATDIKLGGMLPTFITGSGTSKVKGEGEKLHWALATL